MGAIMACLIMAVIPVIIFYLSAQKYIIRGVAAGAVKGWCNHILYICERLYNNIKCILVALGAVCVPYPE